MRAIAIREHGGPEILQVQEVPDPRITGGDLLVRVAAAGVNYIDTYHRAGLYRVELPFLLGMEAAGIVEQVGAGVDNFQVGDRVAWGFVSGSYAELIAVPAGKAVLVPDDVPLDVAAAAMLQGMTAHFLVNSTFQVSAEHSVLVHAGAGGVGRLICQMAAARGARVIATASTPEKREIAVLAGAKAAIDYPNFADAVRELTDGRGVDVVYDGVGKATFDESLQALRQRGLLALFGGSSGQVPPFDLQRLNAGGSLYVTRPSIGHYVATRAELEWRAADLFRAISAGEVEIHVHHRYSLGEAAQAHHDLEARRTAGKLLLLP